MPEEFELVPESVRNELNFRQAKIIAEQYKEYQHWLRNKGKNPDREIGYSDKSVRNKFHRTTQYHRWLWNRLERITLRFDPEYADDYEQALDDDEIKREDGGDYSEGSKRKLQQAAVNWHDFRHSVYNAQPWSPNLNFSQTEHKQADYFTLDEREQLYEASLTYDDQGKYDDLSPDDRESRKIYLAQKLGKPKSEVLPSDFEACRKSWKVPSIISVSLDIGARPSFIERCRNRWFKPNKGVIKIPKGESPKNNAYWESSLSSRSVDMLNRWVSQRAGSSKYSDSDLLWLNREGNAYHAGPLNHLLNRLIDKTGIDQSNRKLTWTSIRRSTGTYLAYFRSLAYAKQQLRHRSRSSTLLYVELPVEARQDALDQLTSRTFESSGQNHLEQATNLPHEMEVSDER
jgi:hypothetical protein